jgi:hypothetical protein
MRSARRAVQLGVEVHERAAARAFVLDARDAMGGADLGLQRQRPVQLQMLLAVQDALPVDAGLGSLCQNGGHASVTPQLGTTRCAAPSTT